MAASDMMSALMELLPGEAHRPALLIDRLEQSLAKAMPRSCILGGRRVISTAPPADLRLPPGTDRRFHGREALHRVREIDVTPKNTSHHFAQHARPGSTPSCAAPPASRSTRSFSTTASVTSSAVPCLRSRPTSRSSRFAGRRGQASPPISALQGERNRRSMGRRYLHNQHIATSH